METIFLVIVLLGMLAVFGVDALQKRRTYLSESGSE
jgi:hypothetical protein